MTLDGSIQNGKVSSPSPSLSLIRLPPPSVLLTVVYCTDSVQIGAGRGSQGFACGAISGGAEGRGGS